MEAPLTLVILRWTAKKKRDGKWWKLGMDTNGDIYYSLLSLSLSLFKFKFAGKNTPTPASLGWKCKSWKRNLNGRGGIVLHWTYGFHVSMNEVHLQYMGCLFTLSFSCFTRGQINRLQDGGNIETNRTMVRYGIAMLWVHYWHVSSSFIFSMSTPKNRLLWKTAVFH